LRQPDTTSAPAPERRAERGTEAEPAGRQQQPGGDGKELPEGRQEEEHERAAPAEARDRLLDAARRELHVEALAHEVAEQQRRRDDGDTDEGGERSRPRVRAPA
jgi:hypothetical protein